MVYSQEKEAQTVLLTRQDWVYLLSLLVPFVVYNLGLKALGIALLPGDYELAEYLNLMQSGIFFNLGYMLLWIGLFAATHNRRPLRRAVIILLHAATILVMLVTAGAYLYFRLVGAVLDYAVIADLISRYDEIPPDLFQRFQSVPLFAWILLVFPLLYATLGPLLLTSAVGRWRGWERRFLVRRTAETTFPSSFGLWALPLGLVLVALGLGSLSVPTGDSVLARDPFVNVILPGVKHPAAGQARLAQTPQVEKRNVVLVHLESTRERSITPYNENLNTTPFLNELAQSSLVGEQAYVGSIPRSLMANSSVNCGIQTPPRGEPGEPGTMPVPCLADLLGDQGYSTVLFSSNIDDYGDYATTLWGYEKVFAPPDPAVPAEYQAGTMDTERYRRVSNLGYEEDIMLKPSEEWLKEQKGKPFLAEYLTHTGHDRYNCLQERYGSENFSEDDLLNHYLNCLRLQDIFLKNLIEQYKELGLYEDTIFVLYGDHGEGFGEHGRFLHGDTIWEEGLRVPLIIHAPGLFENGERVEGLSNQTDILPTIVEMLGYEVEDGEYPGYSLLHELPEDRTLNFSCISLRKCLASIIGNEKYIYHYGRQPEEVFNLSEDPLEEHNLAHEYTKEELGRRRQDLFQWLSKIDAEYGFYLGGSWLDKDTGQQRAIKPEGQPANSTVAVGQPLRVGNVEWTVTNAYLANQLVSAVDSGTKQGNFVVVNLQFKNNSNEGLTLSSDALALLDGNGRRFKFDTDTYLYIDWSKALFRFEVDPGDSREGQVIFKVAPEASQFQLELGEETPFTNNGGYVNLGF